MTVFSQLQEYVPELPIVGGGWARRHVTPQSPLGSEPVLCETCGSLVDPSMDAMFTHENWHHYIDELYHQHA